jgi:hypothetical protein
VNNNVLATLTATHVKYNRIAFLNIQVLENHKVNFCWKNWGEFIVLFKEAKGS